MRNQIQPTIIVIGISFLILGLSLTAFSQPDKKWKVRNDKDNRYEGSIDKEVASEPPIKLISFYSSKEKFNRNSVLKVTFYLKDQLKVYLTAQELENREFYWMEAKRQDWPLGWNVFGPWPVDEVLEDLSISPDNLGILVRLLEEKIDLEKESGPIAPAILYHSSPPSKIDHYTAYFMPGKPLSGGTYEIHKVCEGNELLGKGAIGRQSVGIPFPIEFNLPKDWQGPARLKIVVKIKNEVASVPPSYEYCFYHIPVLDE